MTRCRRAAVLTCAVVALAADRPALADPPVVPETPISKEDMDLLRGPAADETTAKASLVERDASGRLRPLEVSPEEAAFELLLPDLDAGAIERVRAIIVRRTAVWDAFYRENYREVVELSGAFAGGGMNGTASERASLRSRLAALAGKAPTASDQDAFRDAIAAAIPEAQAALFRDLVAERRRAVAAEARADAEKTGQPAAKAAAEAALRAFGLELRRAYERESGFNKERLESAMKRLALGPEDETRVRNALIGFAQQQRFGQASGTDRLRLYRELRLVLSAEQVRTLRDAMGGEERGGGRRANPERP